MKILEAQSAILTNFEVYTHLTEQRKRYESQGKKRRGPGNLETVVKELLDYLRSPPSPLQPTGSASSIPYDETTIRTLLVRLRPYDLTKAEILMIMNHRPTRVAALNTIVEELDVRFPSHSEQRVMVNIIKEVLGSVEGQSEEKGMEGNTDAMVDDA